MQSSHEGGECCDFTYIKCIGQENMQRAGSGCVGMGSVQIQGLMAGKHSFLSEPVKELRLILARLTQSEYTKNQRIAHFFFCLFLQIWG